MAVVLIAEDDAFVRDIAETIIQDSDHQTLLAADVDEALVILHTRQDIDVLFTDIHLREARHGGCDLAYRARELRPNIRILYTTGYFEENLTPMLIPGAPLLPKPYTHGQLTQVLNGLLGSI